MDVVWRRDLLLCLSFWEEWEEMTHSGGPILYPMGLSRTICLLSYLREPAGTGINHLSAELLRRIRGGDRLQKSCVQTLSNLCLALASQ